MIEIINKQKFPVQIMVRSRKAPRAFTTKNIPAVGAGKNRYFLEEERITDDIDRKEKMGLISVIQPLNKLIGNKGE
jgi:hypothetical protein